MVHESLSQTLTSFKIYCSIDSTVSCPDTESPVVWQTSPVRASLWWNGSMQYLCQCVLIFLLVWSSWWVSYTGICGSMVIPQMINFWFTVNLHPLALLFAWWLFILRPFH